MCTTIPADFIGDFKLGDNINYNLDILRRLYGVWTPNTTSPDKLNKPITVIIVSIIEAILADFYNRISDFTFEGVQNVSPKQIKYIRSKALDKLDKYIVQSKKHKFFGHSGHKIYDDLTTLRKARNRIHIQNTEKHVPPDEGKLFTDDLKKLAEDTLKSIMNTLSTEHKRGLGKSGHVEDFILPW